MNTAITPDEAIKLLGLATKSRVTKEIELSVAPDVTDKFLEAINMAIEALGKSEPHWIPVTKSCKCDLMDNEEVRVFQKDGTINGQIRHAIYYYFNDKKKFFTWEEGITIYNVVAYMPLSEFYKRVNT